LRAHQMGNIANPCSPCVIPKINRALFKKKRPKYSTQKEREFFKPLGNIPQEFFAKSKGIL